MWSSMYRCSMRRDENMGWWSIFRKASSESTEDAESESVEYEGYVIHPAPRKEGGKFYTAGSISKRFEEGVKTQRFIRADTHTSRDTAAEHAVFKAKQIIREQGDKLFKDD